jgi:hypothetical protein
MTTASSNLGKRDTLMSETAPDPTAELAALDTHLRTHGSSVAAVIEYVSVQSLGIPVMPADQRATAAPPLRAETRETPAPDWRAPPDPETEPAPSGGYDRG